VEAIIPALSRALQGFDVKTKRNLKKFKLMKNDIRRVERKKIGFIKARKG
jgi:ribosomal protein S9